MAEESEVPVSVEIRATVIRADGTREELGLVDASYRDPNRQARWDWLGAPAAAVRITAANWRAVYVEEKARREADTPPSG